MGRLTPDQIEQVILAEERVIAAARARQMAAIIAADDAQLQTADGCRSLQEWVAARADVAPETARRLTGAARRLVDQPELADRLISGEISFDRAEAMSKIPLDRHSDWLDGEDIRGLQRLAARHRRLEWDSTHATHTSQYLALQPSLDESRWKLWGVLDSYGGTVVDKVLTEVADTVPELPDGTRLGLGYRRAVALTAVCEETVSTTPGTPTITVFVDEVGAEIAGGTAIGPEVLDRIACAASVEFVRTVDGIPLGIGRRSRVIPPRLRRFVLHRDGGCTAEGCTSRYRLEVHHEVPWSLGGATDPDNLITLCWFHHHVVVHGWGYTIDSSLGPGRLRFIRPDANSPP